MDETTLICDIDETTLICDIIELLKNKNNRLFSKEISQRFIVIAYEIKRDVITKEACINIGCVKSEENEMYRMNTNLFHFLLNKNLGDKKNIVVEKLQEIKKIIETAG